MGDLFRMDQWPVSPILQSDLHVLVLAIHFDGHQVSSESPAGLVRHRADENPAD